MRGVRSSLASWWPVVLASVCCFIILTIALTGNYRSSGVAKISPVTSSSTTSNINNNNGNPSTGGDGDGNGGGGGGGGNGAGPSGVAGAGFGGGSGQGAKKMQLHHNAADFGEDGDDHEHHSFDDEEDDEEDDMDGDNHHHSNGGDFDAAEERKAREYEEDKKRKAKNSKTQRGDWDRIANMEANTPKEKMERSIEEARSRHSCPFVGEIMKDKPSSFWQMSVASPSSLLVLNSVSGGPPAKSLEKGVIFGQHPAVKCAANNNNNKAAKKNGERDMSVGFNSREGGVLKVPFVSSNNEEHWTVEGWVKIREMTDAKTQVFLSSMDRTKEHEEGYFFMVTRNSDGSGAEWGVSCGGGKKQDGSSSLHTIRGGKAKAMEWVFFSSTYDGQELKLYVNSELVGKPLACSCIPNKRRPLYMGGASDNGPFFHGYLDEIAIYDHHLPSPRIEAHYYAANPSPPQVQGGDKADLDVERDNRRASPHVKLPAALHGDAAEFVRDLALAEEEGKVKEKKKKRGGGGGDGDGAGNNNYNGDEDGGGEHGYHKKKISASTASPQAMAEERNAKMDRDDDNKNNNKNNNNNNNGNADGGDVSSSSSSSSSSEPVVVAVGPALSPELEQFAKDLAAAEEVGDIKESSSVGVGDAQQQQQQQQQQASGDGNGDGSNDAEQKRKREKRKRRKKNRKDRDADSDKQKENQEMDEIAF